MKGSITNEKVDLLQHHDSQNSKENRQVIHTSNMQPNFQVSDVGLSPLPPEVESLSLGNKMVKEFYRLKTIKETYSYGSFLNSVSLDEKKVEEMSSIYNKRREDGQKHFNNSLPAVVRNKTYALQVNSVKLCDVDQQLLPTHTEMLDTVFVRCLKEDKLKRDEGWFWWFGAGWVDVWIWTKNLLDEIVPPDLFSTSSHSQQSNNKIE